MRVVMAIVVTGDSDTYIANRGVKCSVSTLHIHNCVFFL